MSICAIYIYYQDVNLQSNLFSGTFDPPKSFFSGLGNLADRWPKHIVKAVKNTYLNEEDKGEKFVTLANDPVSPSTAESTSIATNPAKVNLAAVPVGGQNIRPEDAALSPVNAIDESVPSSDRQIVIRGISIPRKPTPPGSEGE